MEPWRKLGERVVYNRFRRVTSRTFQLPTGEVTEFEVIELFDSVVVLALTAANEIVLVREFRPGPEEILLELPGGILEPGRAPVEAAEAELLEETGFRGHLAAAGTMFKDGYATNVKHAFVATGCERVSEPDDARLLEPLIMPLPEFRQHLLGGRLTDTDAGYRGLDVLGLL